MQAGFPVENGQRGANLNMQPPIRILVVDDHPIVRIGIVAMIEVRSDVKVVTQASSDEEAIALYQEHSPHTTLMDVRLPGMGGVVATRYIRALAPKSRFVVLTTYESDEDIH